jgi:hypothetical protein
MMLDITIVFKKVEDIVLRLCLCGVVLLLFYCAVVVL